MLHGALACMSRSIDVTDKRGICPIVYNVIERLKSEMRYLN